MGQIKHDLYYWNPNDISRMASKIELCMKNAYSGGHVSGFVYAVPYNSARGRYKKDGKGKYKIQTQRNTPTLILRERKSIILVIFHHNP